MGDGETDSAEREADSEPVGSGPFCRHWRDPGDCDARCARCGHSCGAHLDHAHEDSACSGSWEEPDCECEAWVEPEA